MGNIDLLTLIALVIAVIAILKLRSVLGRRTSDDEARIDRRIRAREAQERAAAAGEKVVTLPGRTNDGDGPSADSNADREAIRERIETFAGDDRQLNSSLMDIAGVEPSFDPEHFMSGAKQAYEMIVMAFAEGNQRLLRDLLSADVFEGFSEAISDREAAGQQVDQSFVGINSAKMIEAELKDGHLANLTVKFVCQLISATRDRDGEVLSGDPQRVQEVTDVWTFSRDLRSNDPNWRLIGTQSPN
ncbi:MAG: Tim44/TimA family putative adaptor protein [Pseudomonadota bacterium]